MKVKDYDIKAEALIQVTFFFEITYPTGTVCYEAIWTHKTTDTVQEVELDVERGDVLIMEVDGNGQPLVDVFYVSLENVSIVINTFVQTLREI